MTVEIPLFIANSVDIGRSPSYVASGMGVRPFLWDVLNWVVTEGSNRTYNVYKKKKKKKKIEVFGGNCDGQQPYMR